MNIAKISDDLADTESNLTPVILRKIMYRLGFDPGFVDQYEASIHKMINYRNHIVHGEVRNGIEEKECGDAEKTAFDVMKAVKTIIIDCLTNDLYKKK